MSTEDDVTSYVMDYIKKKTPFQKSIMITKSSNHLSIASDLLLEKVAASFPSVILDVSEFRNLSSNNPSRIQSIKSSTVHPLQWQSLHIMLYHNESEKNITHGLIEMLQLFDFFARNVTRAKHILFIINRENRENLQAFFNMMWGNQILDVTVIQMIKSRGTKRLYSSINVQVDTTIHRYNPFNDTYHIVSFSKQVDLFTNNLQNMYGYTLRVGLFDFNFRVIIDEKYNGHNMWQAMSGLDVNIARAAANYSNFTVSFKVLEQLEKFPNLARFNLTNSDVKEKLYKNDIDFIVNDFVALGVNDKVERGIYLYPVTANALVKQYGKMEIVFSYVIIIVSVLIVLVILFLTSTLHFITSNTIWELNSVIHILMFKETFKPLPNSTTERLFFLFIISVSSCFSVYVLDQLIMMNFLQLVYENLDSLQDIVDHNLIPYIPLRMQKALEKYNFNSSVIQYILHMQPSNKTDDFTCEVELVRNNSSVHGCFLGNTIGEMLSYKHSSDKNGWILKFIKEPIAPGYSTMIFPKMSPYVSRFNVIMRRCFEAGLIDKWREVSIKLYVAKNKNLFGNDSFNAIPYMQKMKRELAVDVDGASLSISKRLITICLVGNLTAIATFVFELCWKLLLKFIKDF